MPIMFAPFGRPTRKSLGPLLAAYWRRWGSRRPAGEEVAMEPRRKLSGSITGLIFSMILVGCAATTRGTGDSTANSGRVNFAGTWDSTLTTVTERSDTPAGSQQTAVSAITQSGSSLSGTFTTSRGLEGQVVGTVSGQEAIFAIAQGEPCPGAFAGRGTITSSGHEMNGWFSGFDCGGNLQLRFVATKR